MLILLNVIVSASVTYGVLYYWENVRAPKNEYQLVTVSNDGASGVVPTPWDNMELSVPTTQETQQTESDDESAEILEETQEPTPVIRGAKVEISMIRTPGVLSSEALRIVSNSDEIVSLENWRLEDANGNVLTFPNIQLLRKGVFVEVYSRSGHTTPYEIFWNQTEAVWQSGETAVLKDMLGQIQATYRVP
ncbi:MAG: lamin tail domain-containing protein [Anaerolineaceae bacterium]|nr:lamin tail domain-containing protein [Anaerolineaceae bacterium]